jgi:hypothetical protein
MVLAERLDRFADPALPWGCNAGPSDRPAPKIRRPSLDLAAKPTPAPPAPQTTTTTTTTIQYTVERLERLVMPDLDSHKVRTNNGGQNS